MVVQQAIAANVCHPQDNEPASRLIELPVIPDSLRQPEVRAEYLIVHFWDNADFNAISLPVLEQSLVDFLSVLPHSSSDERKKEGFSRMLDKSAANPDIYSRLTAMTDDYLNSGESPVRNDSDYIIFLNALNERTGTNEIQRARIADRLEMLNKNRRGSMATDFDFVSGNGQSMSLYGFLAENQCKTLLIFFDPECEACEETMAEVLKIETFKENGGSDELQVIAIYPGENREAWIRRAETLPSRWTIGINPGEIEDKELYYLPEMPTAYLIDTDKRVADRAWGLQSILEMINFAL